jgi:hypothetical protein
MSQQNALQSPPQADRSLPISSEIRRSVRFFVAVGVALIGIQLVIAVCAIPALIMLERSITSAEQERAQQRFARLTPEAFEMQRRRVTMAAWNPEPEGQMSPAGQFGIGLAMTTFGVLLIATGMKNVKERKSRETGKRRLVNFVLGQSNSYEGGKAVVHGYLRIIGGVMLLFSGVLFMIYGPMLTS